MKTKLMVRMAMLVALSAIGAYFPFPSPIGTVALDSAPGLFAALVFGGWYGGLVLFLGHLISALKMGFPLGAIHIFIAFMMGGCGVAYYYLKEKINLIVSSIIAIILNGVVVNALLIPLLGKGFFLSMLTSLLIGAFVNILVAGIIFKFLGEKVGIDEKSRIKQQRI